MYNIIYTHTRSLTNEFRGCNSFSQAEYVYDCLHACTCAYMYTPRKHVHFLYYASTYMYSTQTNTQTHLSRIPRRSHSRSSPITVHLRHCCASSLFARIFFIRAVPFPRIGHVWWSGRARGSCAVVGRW